MQFGLLRYAALYVFATCLYIKAEVVRPYGRIPIVFEENAGQAPADAKFLAHGPGYTTLLCNSGGVLRLKTGHASHVNFRMRWVGGSAHPHLSGKNPVVTRSNYFLGRDPSRWRTGIKNYGSVKYSNVYPGIDLVFHGNQRQLEYDWNIAPGGDPRRIAVRFENIRHAALQADGSLALDTGSGEVRQPRPVAWQETSDGSRRYIEARYVVDRLNIVRFELGSYDPKFKTVIDPMLVYSTLFGSAGDDGAAAIAVDAAGAAYVAGYTQPFTAGVNHAFIMKLNPAGDTIVYSNVFGGIDYDAFASGIAVDASGAAYVTGRAYSSNFPVTQGAFQTNFGNPTNHFSSDGFVTKFSPDGATMVYSTYLGGSGGDAGGGIAVDPSGAAYVTGSTTSANFAATPGVLQPSLAGVQNVFVLKLNASGTALVYSTFLGGKCLDQGYAIAIDGSGDAFVTGTALSAEFPTTAGAFQSQIKSIPCTDEHGDAFVSKINATGTALLYSTFLGGSSEDQGNGIAVDAAGNAYVIGTTHSINFPTVAGSYRTTPAGGIIDAFVSKLNPTGTALVYSTYLGGGFYDYGWGIAVDASGNAYVTGSTQSSDFPVTAGALEPQPGWPVMSSSANAYITKLNSAGSGLIYSTYFGGRAYESGNAIALDSSNAMYIAGGASSTNFPLAPGAVQSVLSGTTDAFILKFDATTPCAASLQNSLSVSPLGATISVPVAIPSNCNWFTESRENWVKVVSGSPARGSASVGLQVDGNQGLARSATVQVAGQLLTISQVTNCTYSMASNGSLSFAAKGGTGEFNVTAAFGCNWTPTTDANWIQFISPTAHNVGGAQDYNVLPNFTSDVRQADIHVAGQQITVMQDAGPPPFLSITKTHSGSGFKPGQNVTFTLTVSNAADSPATTGTVFVTDQGAFGLLQGTMTGQGWECSANSCYRGDPLPGGSSYPPITVVMGIAANAPAQMTNSVFVQGGGSPIATAGDPVTTSKASFTPRVRDFRGVGVSDALIYDHALGQEYTALTNGAGGYQYVPNLFSTGFDTLRTGDFNGDGKTDLIVYNSHNAAAYIGMSNGDGTFNFKSLFWSPNYDKVETGDINGDGKADVVLYNSSTGTLYTGVSNGAGAFAYSYHLVSLGFTFVRLADFTGDGMADLLLYNSSSGAGYIGVGDGAGAFTFHALTVSPGYALADIGDLNGDGKADVILYNPANGNAATGISDGAGGLMFTPLLFSPGFTSVRLADYNGDGKADVSVYNANNSAAYFGTGDGAGNFSFQSLFWSAGYDAIEPQDVNGDGKADVVLYNSATGTEYTGVSNGSASFGYTYQYWGIGKTIGR